MVKCDHCQKPISITRAFDTMVKYSHRGKPLRLCQLCEEIMILEETKDALDEQVSRWGAAQ